MKTERKAKFMAWTGIASAITGGIFDLAGTGINAYANHREAEINREWQEKMAKNALQYRVADARAAGINPIFAAGNLNTSAPTGSQAQGNPASGMSQTAKSLMAAEERTANKTAEIADQKLKQEEIRTGLEAAKSAIEKEVSKLQFDWLKDKKHDPAILRGIAATNLFPSSAGQLVSTASLIDDALRSLFSSEGDSSAVSKNQTNAKNYRGTQWEDQHQAKSNHNSARPYDWRRDFYPVPSTH